MAPVLGKRPRFSQQWRPQTDYERWLEEHNESYQPENDAQYHPPLPGVHDQVRVFHRVIDDSPRQRADNARPTHTDVTRFPSHKTHGEFLHQLGSRPPSALKDSLADRFRGLCPCQLALFFVVVIAFLQLTKSLQKRRRRATDPLPPSVLKYSNLQSDEKIPI